MLLYILFLNWVDVIKYVRTILLYADNEVTKWNRFICLIWLFHAALRNALFQMSVLIYRRTLLSVILPQVDNSTTDPHLSNVEVRALPFIPHSDVPLCLHYTRVYSEYPEMLYIHLLPWIFAGSITGSYFVTWSYRKWALFQINYFLSKWDTGRRGNKSRT